MPFVSCSEGLPGVPPAIGAVSLTVTATETPADQTIFVGSCSPDLVPLADTHAAADVSPQMAIRLWSDRTAPDGQALEAVGFRDRQLTPH